ncbi:MAG TPA: hypothetical protein VLQ45_15840 [Thermoanaerobaculia bacterium]|nr:hypothetical protein [Thermoanaerobaculia bacterium]
MTPAIILDTDFLSAFLKIDRLPLVRDFYGADDLLVPLAVYRELSLTNLLPGLASLPWIQIQAPASAGDLGRLESFASLGQGEREAILLARQYEASLLLMNDNKARREAQRLGLEVVNVPAFLLSCKLEGFVDGEEIRRLVQALREKDRYGFRADILDLLLS